MLASIGGCSPGLLKNCALVGLKAAFLHASAFCEEKWAPKFKCGFNGRSSFKNKDYSNYMKRRKRADAKRDLLQWRSCEVYIDNFDKLYWSCGTKSSSKSQKQRNGGQKYHNKWSEDCDENSRCKKHKRSSQANRETSQKEFRHDPFQFIWQSQKSHYSQWWGFLYDEFIFSSERSSSGFSFKNDYKSDSTSKKKVQMEVTIGSPSDRQTLGLSPSGSLTMEELKKAFRLSALKWHPDRHEGAGKATAEAKFKDCGAAYKSLLTALAKT